MRRVFLFSAILWSACASSDAPARAHGSGRFVLSRTAPRPQTLLDTPALALYCALDSTLSIVAVGDRWSAAVAMRTGWPINPRQPFAVGSTLHSSGSGAVAARLLADSVSNALIARSGTITLTSGAPLAGRFEAEIPADSGVATRLDGHFEALVVRTGACP